MPWARVIASIISHLRSGLETTRGGVTARQERHNIHNQGVYYNRNKKCEFIYDGFPNVL